MNGVIKLLDEVIPIDTQVYLFLRSGGIVSGELGESDSEDTYLLHPDSESILCVLKSEVIGFERKVS